MVDNYTKLLIHCYQSHLKTEKIWQVNLGIWSLWHIWKFLAKVTCARNFCKKTCASYLQKFYMTHLQVQQWKLQVKSGVSWALLCCDSDWPITAHCLRKKSFKNRSHSTLWVKKNWATFFTAYNFRSIEQIFTKLGTNHVLFILNIMP